MNTYITLTKSVTILFLNEKKLKVKQAGPGKREV